MDKKTLNTIEKVKDYALSSLDLKNVEPSRVHILSEIYGNIRFIDELFDRKGRCFLLYNTRSPTYGHWTCLLKKHNVIEWYEPYGFPLKSLNSNKYIPNTMDIDPNYIINKIKEGGYRFVQNNKQHQNRNDKNDASCGRHCCLRMACHKMNLKEYNNFLKNAKEKLNMNPLHLAIVNSYVDLLK